MTDPIALLGDCSEDHCNALNAHLTGSLERDDLEYEDVFYPLRHHRGDGLALELSTSLTTLEPVVWGAGDFIYEVNDDVRTMATSVDPYNYWYEIRIGAYDIDVTCVESGAGGDG